MAGNHLVVDGSNIATEGRTAPSLAQLDDAVDAARSEYGYDRVNVIVDATFGHRIDAKERAAYENAVNTGAIITPPAGAIGRGDAFVLQIANKAGADVLSNDSFQEFHGQYQWLFDEGRLLGGKPVPGVGWVFVLRAPVRGPLSRKAVRAAKDSAKASGAAVVTEAVKDTGRSTGRRAGTKAATKKAAATRVVDEATDVATAAAQTAEIAAERAVGAAEVTAPRGSRPRRRRGGTAVEPINEPLHYARFVIDHPIGALVDGDVERFSSHGAYVTVGPAMAYVPLKSMGNPPPRKAREVMKLGETRQFVVERFDPERRGIDLALASVPSTRTDSGARAAKAVAKAAGRDRQTTAEEAHVSAAKKAAAKKSTAKRAPAKKATAAKKSTAKRSPAKKSTAARKSTTKRAPAKKAAAKKTTAKRAPAKKAAAKKTTAKRAPAKKTAAKKTTAKKTTAKRAPAKRAPAKRAPAKKTAAKKTTAKKTTAKRAPAKRAAKKK